MTLVMRLQWTISLIVSFYLLLYKQLVMYAWFFRILHLNFFNVEETECRRPVVKAQQTTHSLHSLSHDFLRSHCINHLTLHWMHGNLFTVITTRTHTRPRKAIMIIITKNNQCFHTNNTMLFFRNHHYLITFFTIVFFRALSVILVCV